MAYNEWFRIIVAAISQLQLFDVLDILLIAMALYELFKWTKGTQAYEVLKGIGMLFLCSIISHIAQLNTVSWLLDSFLNLSSIILMVAILFQPEMRRVLEKLGHSGKKLTSLISSGDNKGDALVNDLCASIQNMARRSVGMLLVFEQKTLLADIAQTGTELDAIISGALLENIFEPNTPLHDGAVIVRGTRIVSAGCYLPLTEDLNLARELGTRHRAAIGLSQVSDSITIVISEETGTISIARDGSLHRHIDQKALKDNLTALLTSTAQQRKVFKNGGKKHV